MLCILVFFQADPFPYMVIPPLCSIIVYCAVNLLPGRWPLAALLTFMGLCLWIPSLLVFIPLIVYGALIYDRQLVGMLLLPWAYHCGTTPLFFILTPVFLSGIAFWLSWKTARYEHGQIALHDLADQKRESDLRFLAQIKELMEKQDLELRLTTLSERNRIARDMHDNTGHLLSRALLQTGALLCAPALPAEAAQGIAQLKETLSCAMDSIRQSVHDLHARSVDLRTHIQALADEFNLCPVALIYGVDSLESPGVKYCFLTIIKEALSNIAKHAIAPSRVTIRVQEHPAFYQLLIRDDGQGEGAIARNGLGLHSIEERVQALSGSVHFSRDHGFHIFVSVPKESRQSNVWVEGEPA